MVLYSIVNVAYPNRYERNIVIDDFVSATWTERFIEAGEVEILLPAVHEHLKFLAPGNLLGCQGSREVMLVESRSIEGGLVKANGKTLEAFFNERYIPDKRIMGEVTMVARGGDILKSIVDYMQTWPSAADNNFGNFSHFAEYQSNNIIDLQIAPPDPDETGKIWTEIIPAGPVYDTLVSLAKKYKIGQSVVWTRMSPEEIALNTLDDADHRFVYTTYQGVDRTAGSENDLVIFSPDLDNFSNANQLLSIAGSKNYVVVIPPEWIFKVQLAYPALVDPWNWVMWNYPDNENNIFGYRYTTIDCTDLTPEKLGIPDNPPTSADYIPGLEKMFRIMRARQEKALIENKRTKIVDGEVTPNNPYVYKKDYNLGDLVEVQGEFGDPLNGVVTEYIRSQDETGERHYPTIVVDTDPVTYGVTTPETVWG